MAKNDDDAPIRQNLADAGCPPELIERFLAARPEERLRDGPALLKGHRRSLLERLHAAQRALDCLDYLLHKMKSSGR